MGRLSSNVVALGVMAVMSCARAEFLPVAIQRPHMAAPAVPNGATRCTFEAFVVETDPAGGPVRQTPGPSGKVVGRLPPVFSSPALDGYPVKVEVEVLGSKAGWFLITHAHDNPLLLESATRSIRGRGCK